MSESSGAYHPKWTNSLPPIHVDEIDARRELQKSAGRAASLETMERVKSDHVSENATGERGER